MSDFITLKTQIQALSYKPLLAEDVKSLIKIDRDLFEKSKQQLKFKKKKGRTASGTNKNGGEGAKDEEGEIAGAHNEIEALRIYHDTEQVLNSADGIFSFIYKNVKVTSFATSITATDPELTLNWADIDQP
ncbi:MAG: hypothetical protein KAH03_06230 [Cocleimonas sp.]|nr:hypothetical protein [Cocleimonas sp.]